ncbi:unnamed protein product [Fraxinus pennsylvanica]|uniref:G domain-containing protein n=1 Tax=Fraxinus pennsylvanica TaxID=56036 RepID=A0AAD2DVC8_9LAMI|nr:unnamed protein product [Fraxinus pennsylvanica]
MPAVVHKGYAISFIHQFHMRKVKYYLQNFHDNLSTVFEEFPGLTISILSMVAFSMFCTSRTIEWVGHIFAYLERIRQPMARLPSIDPNARTILICGYPNVGKSSFIDKITMVNVDVQPCAFTTKSLFVGHTDYKCLRAAVLFFLDISGSCGYCIAQQPLEEISKDDVKLVVDMKVESVKTLIGQGGKPTNYEGLLLTMSTSTEEGVIAVKNAACVRLLDQKVKLKMMSKKLNDSLNCSHIATPKPGDPKEGHAEYLCLA